MYETMQTALYWKGMEAHVQQFVRNCLACTKSKHPTVKYGKLPTKTVIIRPWFEVVIDSIGPYGKNKFRAMTMIDTSTRLVEIQPVDDASSDDAAFVFDRFWLCRYPRPMRVIYDQGTEFKKEFFELLDSYGIHAVPTTTRNPQANGVIERLHRVIGDKLRTQTISTKEEWAAFLHDATFALRATYNTMLKSSPAQATFGRDMLFDVEHTTNWDEQYQRKVAQVAKNNERENAKRRSWTYAPKDKVLLRNDAGPQAKMAPLFSGPYEVIAVRTNGTLVLDKGRYMETIHIRRVIPFKSNVGKTVSRSDNL
ncbi:Pol Polyprotein [Phytophthora megakarya]|uniref:Pol Polyprotein n=1 Tax=Phytophthora megakarya TaxID=4795 RepID=A0A225UUB2_9STRA|nr:Pol Polyprotein [Phytophthora megakarya]